MSLTSRRARRGLLPLALGMLSWSASASAQRMWPPPENITRQQAADPNYWPNDPSYRGMWQYWSWVPMANQMLTGWRAPETAIGTGSQVDRAWGLTIGDPRTLIAVIDSGIEWDNDDLLMAAALNVGELPMPMGATSYDADGDGMITVADYANDPRITCGGATLPHNIRMCRDAMGMPNDPNRNGVLDAGDLIRTFSDGVDTDRNGYVDDISGWDFLHDDNDPFDDTRYGHGTGEARDSTATGNDGRGNIGVCPRCQFVPLRGGDSFITDVTDFAQATLYATDADYGLNRRVRVIQCALGTLNNNRASMAAIDYAWSHNVTLITSMADENSRHHNVPNTNNHTISVHAITHNGGQVENSTSFLAFNTCTNYGGQMDLSVAGSACSSEATGRSSGMTGLLVSYALQRNLNPLLSPEEIRQLFTQNATDINIPESIPGAANFDTSLYPSLPGWDQRFGYGRVDARAALEAVRDGRIPPELDVTSPRWFTTLFPDRPSGAMLTLQGSINARRARSFDYTIEWAPGIEPVDTAWTMLRSERNVTAAVTGTLATLDLSSVRIDNPGEVENRFTLTVRVRATAHYDGAAGDVPATMRRVYYVARDPDLLPGFPSETRSSLESSPRVVDLNGDGRAEVLQASSDGLVHAFRADGTELPGWPVHTNPARGYDPADTSANYLSAAAYTGANRVFDPSTIYESILSTPSVADLDGDNRPEVVIASYPGTVYVFKADGTPYGHGFPYRLPDVRSQDTSPTRLLNRGIFGGVVLADLNNDRRPELIFGAFDGNLYALDANTAAAVPGFPVNIHFNEPDTEYNRLFGSVGVGRFNNDNIPDIAVVSNERLPGDNNYGAAYLIHGDGNMHAGGPIHPNWPVAFSSFNLFPLIAEGLSIAPSIGDVDGDGLDDLGLIGNGPTQAIIRPTQMARANARPAPNELQLVSIPASNGRGVLSNWRASTISFVSAFGQPSFGDLDSDGVLDFIIPGASVSLAINLAGGGRNIPFSHLMGAWNGRTGDVLPGFPHLVEDYSFFVNPSIADVSGDPYPEILSGTGGYYVHAADACGREAAGFPKFTGQWVIGSPAVGDLDGDGTLELVVGTRSGFLYAWHTRGRADGVVQWPTFRHDNAATGNMGTALPFGRMRDMSAAALTETTCPRPVVDAGATDASADASSSADGATAGDASADAGTGRLGGGCGCRTTGHSGNGSRGALLFVGLGLALALSRRKR